MMAPRLHGPAIGFAALLIALLWAPELEAAGGEADRCWTPPGCEHPQVGSPGDRETVSGYDRAGIEPPVAGTDVGEVIVRGAIWGGLVGAGGAVVVQLVAGTEVSPWLVPRFVGSGVVLGVITGVVDALTWSNGFVVSTPNSVRWLTREVPSTFDVRVLEVRF